MQKKATISTLCYHFNSAIVRKPALSVVNGLRAEDQGDPDHDGVKAEHESYVAVLESVGMKVTVLPEGEESAVNAIRFNKSLLVSANYPLSIELLDHNGYLVVPVKTTEIQKINAGLSCMPLRWFTVFSLC